MVVCQSFGISERHATHLHPIALLLVGACRSLADTLNDRLILFKLFPLANSTSLTACQGRPCIITTISSSTQVLL